jgi:hypothetical protein
LPLFLDTSRRNLQNNHFAQAARPFSIPRVTAMVHCRAESNILPRLSHLMKTTPVLRALALVLAVTSTALHAQVPQILNYQGRVAFGDPPVNFDGSGGFKFALVQGEGPTLLWKNDGSAGNTEPAAAVTLPVTKGLYSVLLGANMTPIPNAVFANPDVRLRVWFDDGTANGSQLLTPDQRIAAVGYAMVADTLSPNPTISGTVAATGFSGDGSSLTGLNADNLVGTVSPARLPTGTVINDLISFSYLQPNGSGFEISSNFWTRTGIFVFRGTGTGGMPTRACAVLYTTNSNTWHRIRLFDVTNNQTVAISSPSNI